MNKSKNNPFDILKASDFTYQEILNYWVDLKENSFENLVKPTSQMPMIILGSKGCGKTHILLYFSYYSQKIRHEKNLLHGLSAEGYLGIYYLLGGMNDLRFSGKGYTPETWETIYYYYIDLSITKRTLSIFHEFVINSKISAKELDEKEICRAISSMFFNLPFNPPDNISSFIEELCELMNHIDEIVGECAFEQNLNKIKILLKPCEIIEKLPSIIKKHCPSLNNIKFLYMFDEMENISFSAQKYYQTMIRICKNPEDLSIKLSGRLYSIKTYETYCSEEKNLEGSEFNLVKLDDKLREASDLKSFFSTLCEKRLKTDFSIKNKELLNYFVLNDKKNTFKEDRFGDCHAYFLNDSNKKVFFIKLKQKLKEINIDPNIIKKIIILLENSNHPFIEKVNTFLFYKLWSKDKKKITVENKEGFFLTIANNISRNMQLFLSEKDYKKSEQYKKLEHFKKDIIAQLLREHERELLYLGFDEFTLIASGCPRNLLQILKETYNAALNLGEEPLINGNKFSIKAQQLGLRNASKRFFDEAFVGEDISLNLKESINNLAVLFRTIRYSDNPSECSPLSFSVDIGKISKAANENIKKAVQRSLLLKIPDGRNDKKKKENIQNQYKLNPMLSPYWDLPIRHRGCFSIDVNLLNSIFDTANSKYFDSLLKKRTSKMNAPFNCFKSNKNDDLFSFGGDND